MIFSACAPVSRAGASVVVVVAGNGDVAVVSADVGGGGFACAADASAPATRRAGSAYFSA
jgi:hypothetical protein